ncbi:MAG: dienelactone hydrolase family protein [Phycisphaerae bacterium]|nr:dienelactone hydrolase family protein [Phycisphaerae bacterium]
MINAEIQTRSVQITPNLKGFLALPPGGHPRPAILIYYEVFGLDEHFKEMARKVAAMGYVALVPDVMGGKVFGYHEVQAALPAARAITDAQFVTHARDSVTFLQNHPSVLSGHTGQMGFCLGGRWAFLAATGLGAHIQASVAYYGGGIDSKDPRYAAVPSLLPNISGIQSPLLLHYGAQDKSILPEEIGRITTALAAAGKTFGVHVFAEAGHAFANNYRESHHPAVAADAWNLTFFFFHRYLGAAQMPAQS